LKNSWQAERLPYNTRLRQKETKAAKDSFRDYDLCFLRCLLFKSSTLIRAETPTARAPSIRGKENAQRPTLNAERPIQKNCRAGASPADLKQAS
jgi:hypothetical protein